MKILDRYLLRQFLAWSAIGLVTFVLLFVVVDLFEKIDLFVDYKTPVGTIARFYAYGLTTIITQVLPVSLLLGALLSLGQLRKFNELTAMQASGRSPWRLSRPLLAAALLLSIAQYGLNERFAAEHYLEKQRILTEEIKKLSAADRESQANVRLLGAGRRFWVAQFFDARSQILRNVSVQWLTTPTLSARIDAERARYTDGVWRFERGFFRTFHDSTEVILPFRAMADSRIAERPEDFARRKVDPFRAGMKELLQYARRVGESGGEVQAYMTDFHLRASYPLSGLILVVLGTGLSLRVIRGSGFVVGIGVSLAVGFAYLAVIRAGQALGYNGTLPPALAAWLGNLVFGTIGGIIFWRVAR
ncbi:MAG: LptF/LptG family permease [Candidatus Eisenbacteria bacterium]